MKLKEILPNVYLVTARKASDLARTFVRFQESYESPSGKFRGKTFDLERFKTWYRKGHKGVFSYYSDWGGFNVPGTAINRFFWQTNRQVRMNGVPCKQGNVRLSKQEHWLVSELYKQPQFSWAKPFYVIAAAGSDKSTLTHEMAHALYFISKPYRELVQDTIAEFQKTKAQKRRFQ